MANHCINLICTKCGARWCCRGCGYSVGPSKERLDKFMKRKKEWAEKFEKDLDQAFTWMSDDACEHCNSMKVCMS